jgi:mannose-1-phosphate guanylyltransferase
LEPEILEMIPPNQKISVERDIYPKVAGNGLYGFPFEGYFIDSGTPESYLEANFKSIGKDGTAIHRGASIRGPSLIHKNAELQDCIIGPNAIIGSDVKMEKCVVRRSVILSYVNSYGSVIEDCIIGPNISIKKDINRSLISPEGAITF